MFHMLNNFTFSIPFITIQLQKFKPKNCKQRYQRYKNILKIMVYVLDCSAQSSVNTMNGITQSLNILASRMQSTGNTSVYTMYNGPNNEQYILAACCMLVLFTVLVVQCWVIYVYGSVHHNIFYEITNRCSYMQSILFYCQVHSICFGCLIHPSSGVQFLTICSHWYKPYCKVQRQCYKIG